MKKFILLSLSLLAVSCGETGKYSTPTNPISQKKVTQNQLSPTPSYAAELTPLNGNLAGTISGSANFKIDGDNFYAYIRLFNSLSGLIHEQRFYQASSCPTIEQDINGDGFIDIMETNEFLGQPIFPLDADITSLEAGKDTFMAGDAAGNYWYEQIVNHQSLVSELHQGDKSMEDDFVGLPVEENLSLDEGVVIIMGVPSYTVLPETVATNHGYANFQTLPIACGSLRKIYVVPGKVEDDRGVHVGSGPVGGAQGEYDNATVIIDGSRKDANYGDDDL